MNALAPNTTAAKYYQYALEGVPCLSQGIAYTLVCESPAKAWLQHPQLGGVQREPTPEMEQGTAFHSMVLGKGTAVVEIHADNFKGKHAQDMAEIARQAGKVPLLTAKFAATSKAAEVARGKIEALGHAFDGQSEVAAYWEEVASDGTVVQCCGSFDHLRKCGAKIIDLKKCADANPAVLPRHMTDYGCDIQEVAYRRALCAVFPELAGREDLIFMFCELAPPHSVTPMASAGSMLALGEIKWRKAIDLWAHCLATNTWPDYVTETVRAEAPTWELNRWMAA